MAYKNQLVLILLFLTGCTNNSETKKTVTATNDSVLANTNAAIQPTAVKTETPARGSRAGFYATGGSGGGESYELKYENGKYTGIYTMVQWDNDKTTDSTWVVLEDIVVDETKNTISFKQGGKQHHGEFATEDGDVYLSTEDNEYHLMNSPNSHDSTGKNN